jgi:STE24 endopeptidase
MQPVILLAIVFAISSLTTSEHAVAMADIKLAWSALLIVSVIAFAWWQAAMQRQVNKVDSHSRRSRITAAQLHGWVYLASVLVIFRGCEFAGIVRNNLQLNRFPLADEVLVLVPVILPLVGSWLVSMPPVAAGSSSASRALSVWCLLRFVVVPPLGPLLAIVGLMDLLSYMAPQIAQDFHFPLFGAFAVGFVILLPVWLRIAWPTSCMPEGDQRATVEAVLKRARISIREILVLRTGGQIANAALAGTLPGVRYLFFSEALLERLDKAQIAAVTAHEAAHCQLHHMPRLLVSLLLAGSGLLCATSLASHWPLMGGPALAIVFLGAWAIGHGHWARILEHQADWAACRTMADDAGCVDKSIVRQYCGALCAVNPDGAGDWLHPSTWEREKLLFRIADDPAAFERLSRRVVAGTVVQVVAALALIATAIGIGA